MQSWCEQSQDGNCTVHVKLWYFDIEKVLFTFDTTDHWFLFLPFAMLQSFWAKRCPQFSSWRRFVQYQSLLLALRNEKLWAAFGVTGIVCPPCFKPRQAKRSLVKLWHWSPFLESPETFRAHLGWHNSLLHNNSGSRHETLQLIKFLFHLKHMKRRA